MHRKIQAVEERQQLLHHCAIWDLRTGVHIVGNKQSEVIQATVVEFDDETLKSYVKVIDDIKDQYLFWAYNDSKKVPREVINVAKTIGKYDVSVQYNEFYFVFFMPFFEGLGQYCSLKTGSKIIEGSHLYNWCKKISKKKNNGSLKNDEEALLNAVDFKFDLVTSPTTTWVRVLTLWRRMQLVIS